MKKLLSILLLVLPMWAAVSSNTQWDVRTTGNDNNGGGFVAGASGTDFSQQSAAQYTFADLASSNGTTNPCVVSSASHSFVAADVGNILHVSAGTNWTTGWYQIVSVASNNATLDRACGSVASLSGGTYFVGGALLTVGQAATNVQTAVAGAGGSIDGTIWIQSGTYTLTATITSANFNYALIGYGTTHGDFGTAPLITTATNSTNLFTISSAALAFDNINFSNTAAIPAIGINGGTVNFNVVKNASFTGFTNALSTTAGFIMTNVEVKNSTGSGIVGGFIYCDGCYVHNNTGSGLDGTGSQANMLIVNSLISNNGAHGIVASGAQVEWVFCTNSDIANNTTDGIRNLAGQVVLNSCVIYGNGGFGVNGDASPVNVWPYDFGRTAAYGNNTSGARNNFGYPAPTSVLVNTNAAQGAIALTANPFTSATNFALNSTAGGGTLLSQAGWPGTFPGGTTTSTSNVGAVQSAPAGGSGSGTGHMNSITLASFQ